MTLMAAQLSTKNKTSPPDKDYAVLLTTFILYKIGAPALCIFGIIGNVLNVIVLTRKQLQQSMDRMEKSVHLGLVALAVSDMFFCVVALPTAFIPNTMIYTEEDSLMSLYYNAYGEPLFNTFLLSSTWLTVAMATGRYMGICYPLHARGFINLKATRLSISAIFIISVLFNMPQFWRYRIPENMCAANCKCYILAVSDLYKNNYFVISYKIMWAIFGVSVPLFILAFCNICLIRALKESHKMRQMYRANRTNNESGHRLTTTLITIVAMFIILVSPSEILKFLEAWVINSHGDRNRYNAFVISKFVVNFLQIINFTINFVLYCVINVHFRKTVKSVLCCMCNKQDNYKYSNTNTLSMNISECGEAMEM